MLRLLGTGRKPYTEGLGLENVGPKADNRGRIEVNSHFQTAVSSIYAIGDVIAGPMLAHKAEEEGIAAVEIRSAKRACELQRHPQRHLYVAGSGHRRLDGRAGEGKRHPVQSRQIPVPRQQPLARDGRYGWVVKIIADAKTDRVYGVHIVGPQAGTLIAEAAIALEYGASSEDIARTCHAHPTYNEAAKEAALAVFAQPIHI